MDHQNHEMTYWSDFLEQKWNSKQERKQVLNKEKRMKGRNTSDITMSKACDLTEKYKEKKTLEKEVKDL